MITNCGTKVCIIFRRRSKIHFANLQQYNFHLQYHFLNVIWNKHLQRLHKKDRKLQIAKLAHNDPKQQFLFEGKQDLDQEFANFTTKMIRTINLHTNDMEQQNLQKKRSRKTI